MRIIKGMERRMGRQAGPMVSRPASIGLVRPDARDADRRRRLPRPLIGALAAIVAAAVVLRSRPAR